MPELNAPLVGMRFRPPALTIVQGLGMDQPLRLRREPENQHDENAIAVLMPEDWAQALPELFSEAQTEAESLGNTLLEDETHLGYIAAFVAKDWAPVFDEAEDVPMARLTFGANGSPQVTILIDAEGEADAQE